MIKLLLGFAILVFLFVFVAGLIALSIIGYEYFTSIVAENSDDDDNFI